MIDAPVHACSSLRLKRPQECIVAEMVHNALPHQYGAEVQIRDALDFARSYGIQADGADRFVVIPPARATLVEWARSCLGLGPYEGMHSCGGWSVFRSAVVAVHYGSVGKVEHFHYKLGDSECYDFTSRTRPTHFPLSCWLDTVRSFVRVALMEQVRAEKDRIISPRAVVKKMVYVEYGSAGDEFTLLLCRAGIELKVFDEMVDQAWDSLVRLPTPSALRHAPQDQVVQNFVIALAGRGAGTKGLRV